MKCTKCQLELPETSFDVSVGRSGKPYRRGDCRQCRQEAQNARRKGRVPADPLDAVEVVEEVPPLESAQQGFAAKVEKNTLRQERDAAVVEAERLRKELFEVGKLQRPLHPQPILRHTTTKGQAVACMVASDWHVEEPVESEKVHGLNEYNLAVAHDRAEYFFRNGLRLVEIFRESTKIDTIWLGLLGDFFSGHIHEELRETNEMAPGEAAREVQTILARGIDYLLKESPFKLIIDAIPGNHGRMTMKPRIQNATETSLETFMYHALAGRYEGNPRVEFRVAGSKMLYRRFFDNFTMRLLHGDDVKFGGGVGGITIPIRKKLAAWDSAIRADLTVMGHFHQLFDGGNFLVNGSLIGYNEFAQAIGASPEEARQAFFLVHDRNGGEKSITAPIWLDNAHHGPATST